MSKVLGIVARLKARTDRFSQGTVCWVHKDHAPDSGRIKVIAGRTGCRPEVMDLHANDLVSVEVRRNDYKSVTRWTGDRADAMALALAITCRDHEQG